MSGLFIAFEGGEGAGKDTQIDRLVFNLMQAEVTTVVTREPGSTRVGSAIRKMLLDFGHIPPRAEALLYAADRAAHVESIIRPALERGAVVLCNRYIDSSVAYQGFGRKLGLPNVGWLADFAADSLQPDLTVLLDIDPAEGLRRAAARGGADRIEAEHLEFHQLVRAGFLACARQNPGRYLVLDATKPAETLASAIATQVAVLITRNRVTPDGKRPLKDRSSC